jgi:hypothetical protein
VGAVLCGAQGAVAAAFELKERHAFPVMVVSFDDSDAFPEDTEFFGVLCRRCMLKARRISTALRSAVLTPVFVSGHYRRFKHEIRNTALAKRQALPSLHHGHAPH